MTIFPKNACIERKNQENEGMIWDRTHPDENPIHSRCFRNIPSGASRRKVKVSRFYAFFCGTSRNCIIV